jgi:cell division protein FtsQ
MSALGRAGDFVRVRRLPRFRIGPRVVAAVVLLVLLLGGAYLWLRDSSLVAVKTVRISGNAGPDQTQIARALRAAARGMTTLDVDVGGLRTAVAPYPVVKDVQVSTNFPHGLRIHVVEQIPVAALVADGHAVAVSGDGTLLRDVSTGGLPTIPVHVPPGGTQLSDATARQAVAVLSAAPYAILSHISQVSQVSGHGVVAQLRSGPAVVFGTATQLPAKWSAAAAVLADSGSAGAGYVDVTDPARPAAGATLGATSS